ncbi:hypothetical protein GIB67_022397 [Kingdonia uniflora]|uniref:Uncharacterized protein n=1 Tax=Kingdonia uniflora TaxID=39325 RepID=A0A7J7MU19_9MAGN|nr:hypothetical protein GIB67_022397 [Kingdonia uniflora]
MLDLGALAWNIILYILGALYLESGGPKGSVKRTELFLACHTKQDGTFPEQMKDKMEQINRLIKNEPKIIEKDLEHDPIALVSHVNTS